MSCRVHPGQSCTCYYYKCGCGAEYAHTSYTYHWTEPGESCVECTKPIPDIGCRSTLLEILPAAREAVAHFEHLLNQGCLDDRKDAEHVAALRQLVSTL